MSSNIETVNHTITFSQVQREFMEYTGKQALLYGGFGGGKTRIGNEKGYLLNMKYPGNRGLIVRSKSSDVAGSTIEQSLLEDVIPEGHVPDDPSIGHNQTKRIIRHYTGETTEYGEPVMSEIHYHGLDSSGSNSNDGLPRRISGMQFGWIFVDEATEVKEAEWVQLLGRLRYDGKEMGGKKYTVPFRQIFGATNPAGPQHWLYQKFYENADPEDEDLSTFHIRAEDNPGVPDDYVKQLTDNYSGIYYERYVLGNWVGAAEAIYDAFDRRKHVVDLEQLQSINSGWKQTGGTIRPPDDWKIYRSIDFGYPSPMVVQWWAIGPDDRYVLFREFYKSETLLEDLVDPIKKYSQDVFVTETFADPAQASDRESLERHGITTSKAKKDVWNGIQAVMGVMNGESDGHPNLLFYEDALINGVDTNLKDVSAPVRTVDEIPSYEWSSSKDDKPKKVDDHGMDAMRYCIYSREHSNLSYIDDDYLEEFEQMINGGDF